MTEEPNLLQPQASREDTMLKKAFKETAPDVISTTEKQESNDDNNLYDGSHDLIKLGPLTIIWQNVIMCLVLHVGGFYGAYLTFAHAKWQSLLFVLFVTILGALGVTAGAHRLWTHRSYKAKLPLRIFLVISNTIALQHDIYNWIRDHRVHHKFTETNADPTNVNRGFFFSHIGWLMVHKQKDVIEKGNTIDYSDAWADPVIRIQRRLYAPLALLFSFIIPFVIPYYYWNEHWTVCLFGVVLFRVMIALHITGLGNSVAHLWGLKPYDKNMTATDGKWLSILTLGDGFHNYHHAFPSDCVMGELGYKYNFTAFFIDCMAYIGQAYDLRTTSPEIVYQRKLQRGDGSYLNESERKEWAHYDKSN